jgi:hypothetical protein
MKTAPLVVAVVTAATLPALLSSFGCNKKEDAPPTPSATAVAVATPPTTAAPTATPLLPTQPNIPLMKTVGPRSDAGAAIAKGDAAVAVAKADAAAPPVVGLPPGFPTIALPHPSALPGLASSVVGGIIQNLPPPIIPPPNPSQ